MDRKEDLLEAQRYRRTQVAAAMFGADPSHVPQTGPGPWGGFVLGVLVAGALCAFGPVIAIVTESAPAPTPTQGPVTPAVTPAVTDGQDASH